MNVNVGTQQVSAESLYAILDRACTLASIALAFVWLFAAFCYYLEWKTGGDWFLRSGSVMGLIGAVTSFRLAGVYQKLLAIAFHQRLTMVATMTIDDKLITVRRQMELVFDPPKRYQRTLFLGYSTGVIGTAIWGYGDKLIGLVVSWL